MEDAKVKEPMVRPSSNFRREQNGLDQCLQKPQTKMASDLSKMSSKYHKMKHLINC